MSSEDPRKSLARHVAVHRARKSNVFSARGPLACRENFLLFGLSVLCAAVALFGTAFRAGDDGAPAVVPLPQGQLVVVMLDIRQGDSIFIQTPDLKRILVDAGPAPTDRDTFSAGRDKIVPWLQEHGIDHLDAFVLSHAHADHIGGLAYLLQSIPVDRVYDPGFAFTTPSYTEALEVIEKSDGGIVYKVVQQGNRIPLGNDVVLQVLAPGRPFLSGTRSDCNSNSVILRLAYKQVSFLFMGDAEEETEKLVADYGAGLHSTFLKVAHHGSRYASSAFFLDLVRPLHAFISCGKNNTFGHPTVETLGRLEAVGAKVHRTDENGDITILSDGERYKIVHQKNPA